MNEILYGLRQASRQWYAMLKKCLLVLGFEQCLADSCVFRLIRGGTVVLILVVHVDAVGRTHTIVRLQTRTRRKGGTEKFGGFVYVLDGFLQRFLLWIFMCSINCESAIYRARSA